MVVMAPAARSHHFRPVYVFLIWVTSDKYRKLMPASHRQSAWAVRDSGCGPVAAGVTIDMLRRCLYNCADLRCVDGHLCKEPYPATTLYRYPTVPVPINRRPGLNLSISHDVQVRLPGRLQRAATVAGQKSSVGRYQ
jgi:hypothetical protein